MKTDIEVVKRIQGVGEPVRNVGVPFAFKLKICVP